MEGRGRHVAMTTEHLSCMRATGLPPLRDKKRKEKKIVE
jgi:hypothetical protein